MEKEGKTIRQKNENKREREKERDQTFQMTIDENLLFLSRFSNSDIKKPYKKKMPIKSSLISGDLVRCRVRSYCA